MKKDEPITHGSIKNYNRRKIISLLISKRELTKQEISLKTKISIPTVTANVNELIKEGIIEESGVASSSGGRKPVLVRFIPDSRLSFGVDINVERAKIALVNLDCKILDEITFSIASFHKIEEMVKRISKEIDRMIAENKIDEGKVLGIGFSLPGTVNEKKMLLELAPNLKMKNINFKQFNSIFRFPFYIENEANAGAIAEHILSGSKINNFVYVSITQGVGTGVIINGHLYKGKNQRAGEFGHMVIIPEGKQCNCGRKGCWELYVSERALLSSYANESGENVGLDDFMKKVYNKDKIATEVWNNYIEYLSIGIENMILGLDPTAIIIGGNIAKYEDLLVEPIKSNIFSKDGFEGVDDVKIYCSKFVSEAPLLGAALLPIQKVIS
ncbi:MAG: ROK family transcriptional regulator [Brevinematia bacterium]